LFKSCPPGLGKVTKWKTIYTCVYIENNIFLQNQQANFNQTLYKSSFVDENEILSKKGPGSRHTRDDNKNARIRVRAMELFFFFFEKH
jgi:hypothetical protein